MWVRGSGVGCLGLVGGGLGEGIMGKLGNSDWGADGERGAMDGVQPINHGMAGLCFFLNFSPILFFFVVGFSWNQRLANLPSFYLTYLTRGMGWEGGIQKIMIFKRLLLCANVCFFDGLAWTS